MKRRHEEGIALRGRPPTGKGERATTGMSVVLSEELGNY